MYGLISAAKGIETIGRAITASSLPTTALPTVTTAWTLYNDSVLNYTQDNDIQEAFSEAMINFNEGLFPDDATRKLVFLYLAAHYLTAIASISTLTPSGRAAA